MFEWRGGWVPRKKRQEIAKEHHINTTTTDVPVPHVITPTNNEESNGSSTVLRAVSYWDSKDAKALFGSPTPYHFVSETIDLFDRILDSKHEATVADVLQGGDEAEAALNPCQAIKIREQIMLLRAAFCIVFAGKGLNRDELDQWSMSTSSRGIKALRYYILSETGVKIECRIQS